MFLRRVEVENFRAYEAASFDLPRQGLTLVVGPNNSGKSALLAAIDVLSALKPGAGAARAGANERSSVVRGRFSLSDDEREQLLRLDGFPSAQWGEGGLTEVELEFRAYNAERMWLDAIRINAGVDGAMSEIATNYIRTENGQFLISTADLKVVVTEGPGGSTPLTDRHGGNNMFDGLLTAQYLAPLDEWIRSWQRQVYHFEALRTGATRKTPSHGVARLDPTGADLPQALLHIMSSDDPDWDEIVRVMQSVVPGVGKLAAPVEGSEVEIAFRDPDLGTLHNLKDLGTGVEQLLMTVYVGVRQPPGSLVIIEEPETNLHPGAQRTLLRYLSDWARDRSFVIATHSPVFLDDRTGCSQVLLVERDAGVSSVRQATTSLEDVLDAFGVKFSDVLSADKIILVEGETDASVMRSWFPELTLAHGVAIAPMHGGDQAHHVDFVLSVLAEADRLGRELLLFRDRDELPEQLASKLEATGLVHVLHRRELENYLLDTPAIRAVLSRQEQDAGSNRKVTSSAPEIEELLRQAADGLRSIVVLKRVVSELGAVRLVARRDIQQLAKDSPTAEALAELVMTRSKEASRIAEGIAVLWADQEAAVDQAWAASWRKVAPGAELLEAVWLAHGGRFDKARDGAQIAFEMAAAPEELESAIRAFLDG